MRATATALFLLLAPPAAADVADVVHGHILPGYDRFAQAAAALADEAAASCDPAALAPAYHRAFDAWMGVQHIHLGPAETDGRGLAIAFWPDPKGLGRKAQLALLEGDPARLDPAAFAQQSVAARGLMGLERLLWPDVEWPADTCPLIRATATDLAATAATLRDEWRGGYGDLVLTAGEAGNTAFLSEDEARQALLTVLAGGLEHLATQRIGRPMGTFDRPTPERAEARASGRSLRNVTLALKAHRDMAALLTDAAPRTLAALDKATALAEALDDPILAGTATPSGRLKVEALQQAVEHARLTAIEEIGAVLGVGIGFNSMDGD